MLLFKKAIVKLYYKKNIFSRVIYTHISHSTLSLALPLRLTPNRRKLYTNLLYLNLIRILKKVRVKKEQKKTSDKLISLVLLFK